MLSIGTPQEANVEALLLRDVSVGIAPDASHPSPARRDCATPLDGRFEVPAEADREALFVSFAPLVRRLCNSHYVDADSRQDLQGEIYCKFCSLLDAYDPSYRIPLRAYLVRSLTAAAYTYARSRWRRQQREISLDAAMETADAARLVDPHPSLDECLADEVFLAALPAAIGRIPRRQRQVLISRYYDHLSFEEIAENLEIQVTTARSLLRHAINNLRSQVKMGLLRTAE